MATVVHYASMDELGPLLKMMFMCSISLSKIWGLCRLFLPLWIWLKLLNSYFHPTAMEAVWACYLIELCPLKAKNKYIIILLLAFSDFLSIWIDCRSHRAGSQNIKRKEIGYNETMAILPLLVFFFFFKKMYLKHLEVVWWFCPCRRIQDRTDVSILFNGPGLQ